MANIQPHRPSLISSLPSGKYSEGRRISIKATSNARQGEPPFLAASDIAANEERNDQNTSFSENVFIPSTNPSHDTAKISPSRNRTLTHQSPVLINRVFASSSFSTLPNEDLQSRTSLLSAKSISRSSRSISGSKLSNIHGSSHDSAFLDESLTSMMATEPRKRRVSVTSGRRISSFTVKPPTENTFTSAPFQTTFRKLASSSRMGLNNLSIWNDLLSFLPSYPPTNR